jgi:hypothetical protein
MIDFRRFLRAYAVEPAIARKPRQRAYRKPRRGPARVIST